MADLVRVKDKFQVTIPLEVRSATKIRTGDYLEVSAVAEGILLRPQRVVNAKKSSRTILDFLKESRAVRRTKANIDKQLNAQRDEW
jgi:AbrB family looped-hinge helix DNA binding protein